MKDGSFEWDDRKAAANFAKHGVPFEIAAGVFKDPLAVERIDDRENFGEVRLIIIGMVEGALLFVAYTEREGRIRLISARRATRQEQDNYFAEDG